MLTTLRTRLIASYIGVVLLCLLLAGGAFLLLLGQVQNRTIYRDLTSNSYLLVPQIRTAILTNERPRVVATLAGELMRTRLRVLVLSKDGTVVNDTLQGGNNLNGYALNLQPTPPDSSVPNGPAWGHFNDARGNRWYYVEMNLRAGAGAGANPPPGVLGFTWLLVQQPLGPGEIWDTVGRQLLLAGGLALLIALLLGTLLARSVARPVDRLARATEEVARGNYAIQVPMEGTSELRGLAERFNAMTAEVRKAHQMERDFLTNVSHDLKTPLTAIQGFSQALLDGVVQGQGGTEQAARVINSEARRMSRMVADLLDLAKLESGQTPLERVPTDPLMVLRQAVDTMQFQAREAQVGLHIEGGPLPAVLADPDRLRRALINLLDNALRHTPPGGLVTARGEAGPGVVILSVRDTGAGIPPDDLPHIFERFYQVDKSRSQARSNSGLGLAIVQQIVQAHQGTISVVSQVGVGTEFRIQLPVQPARPPPGDGRRLTTPLKLPVLHR